jgi:hypothetical protein
MDKKNILNHNEVLINIRDNYGRIEERLRRESVRILNDEYNIKVGDIVLDRNNNMGVITGVWIYGLHDYIIFDEVRKDVGVHIYTHRINSSNGGYSKTRQRLDIWGDIDTIKVVGNVKDYNTNKERKKLYDSLNIKKQYV